MIWPEHARLPAPKEKCWIPVLAFSDAGSMVPSDMSQPSGLKVEALGPKWSISRWKRVSCCDLKVLKEAKGAETYHGLRLEH
jgi:hypothetical protein